MRLLRLVLCTCLAIGAGVAQRHGGGGFSGGMRGGSVGGGFRGGSVGGGFRGGTFNGGGFRGGSFNGGGFVGNRSFGFNGGFRNFGGRNFGFHGGFFGGRNFGFRGFRGFGYWPYSFGFAAWPYYGYGYGYPYDYGYGYDPYDYPGGYAYPASYAYPATYSAYQPAPASNVTVVYPPQSAERPNPMLREYDQYGNEMRHAPPQENASASSGGSPIYLVAFKDRAIRAVAAYWVDGNTLHYVTLERQEHQVSLDAVDRAMSEQLNRERRVPFSLAPR
jgi:hypothetical protein